MQDFLNYIPHRPPFLFVDRVIEESENLILTEKDVKPGEPYFQGHYPGMPIMPGVLILESVFQSGAILMSKNSAEWKGKIPVLTRVNNVKFKNPVLPGTTLQIEVKLKEVLEPAFYLTGKASVDNKSVLTVDFSGMLVEETG
jgi:3-hydroxyacyl-[acyl-carrier-protein] dehydratase